MPSKLSAQAFTDVSLFQGLAESAVTKILAACDDVSFAENEIIFRAGDISTALFVLTEGEVDVLLDAPHHLETPIARLAAKSVFGESSFFGGGAHHATLRCVTPVQAIRLDRAAFDSLIAENCTAALRIGTNAAIVLAIRLQAADQRIAQELQEEQDARIKVALQKFHQSLVNSFSGSAPTGFMHTA